METRMGEDIDYAAAVLKAGGLVAIPTETVYGLAANALNADAVLNIYETKGRPSFNPLIVHVHGADQFEKYAKAVPPLVQQLASRFSPGPITFVLPKKDLIPDIVTGGGDTVALRVPAHPMALQLLTRLDFPLAAPSANPFGYISPVTAAHVMDQLQGKIPYILDGGHARVGVESTVIAVEDNLIQVLRVGGVTIEEIHKCVPVASLKIVLSAAGARPAAPGMLKSHYAPKIKLHFGKIQDLLKEYAGRKNALLSFSKDYSGPDTVAKEILSPGADLHEAASRLFAAMRRLDNSGAELILAERFPEEGLGLAINDRLERASA